MHVSIPICSAQIMRFFCGSLRLSNALTLGKVGADDIVSSEPDKDAEANYEQDAKYVNYRELKQGGDGALFYDKDRDMLSHRGLHSKLLWVAMRPGCCQSLWLIF